jgi:cell division protein FtsN
MSVTRDYAKKNAKKAPVKRKRAPKKSNTPTRSKNSNKQSSKRTRKHSLTVPWGSASLAIGSVIALGYILFVLSQTAPTTEQSKTSSKNNITNSPTVAEPATKEKEIKPVEFTFHDLLKNKNVKVDNSPPVKASESKESRYIMQCGSFLKPEQADALKAKIAFTGLVAAIQATDEKDGKTWYRVVLGPYTSKRTADQQRSQLQHADINGCRIW